MSYSRDIQGYGSHAHPAHGVQARGPQTQIQHKYTFHDPPEEFYPPGQPRPASPSPPPEPRRSPRNIVSPRNSIAQPSGEEVEAGLALAGLGVAPDSPQANGKKRPASTSPKPMAKKKDNGKAKDQRKSCSECRRLKAKCDRVFPCSNCRRRGCALVCPDGDLSCMQGKRLVLASTEQLHDRVAQLEAALFHAHSKTASGQHPLLAPQYLDGGFASLPPPEQPPPRSNSSNRMAVETLLLSDDVVATRQNDWVSDNSCPALLLPRDTLQGDRHTTAQRLQTLLALLPPRDEARRRAAKFFEYSVWFQWILYQDEYEKWYEPAVYAPTPENQLSPHKLACVLMVLCFDCMMDISREDEDPRVALFWDAAQQCFDTRFGWAATIPGVQALALISMFVGLGWRGARYSNFYWLRQMTTATQQLGLHREPHPTVPPEEANFRRRVFYETFLIDCLMSINHGQRTAIPLENIETAMPTHLPVLFLLKYDYMRRINYRIIDLGLRPDSNPATPEEICAVDEEMVKWDVAHMPEFHSPAVTGQPIPDGPEDVTKLPALLVARTANSSSMFKSSLFLYRPSLRRLVERMRREPDTPLSAWEHRVATRTFETCRCAALASIYVLRIAPRLATRTWTTWVQIFTCAVSITAIATHCGKQLGVEFVNRAVAVLNDLCMIVNEHDSERSRAVHTLMPILHRKVVSRFPHLGGTEVMPKEADEVEDMVFALLGGSVSGETQHAAAGLDLLGVGARPSRGETQAQVQAREAKEGMAAKAKQNLPRPTPNAYAQKRMPPVPPPVDWQHQQQQHQQLQQHENEHQRQYQRLPQRQQERPQKSQQPQRPQQSQQPPPQQSQPQPQPQPQQPQQPSDVFAFDVDQIQGYDYQQPSRVDVPQVRPGMPMQLEQYAPYQAAQASAYGLPTPAPTQPQSQAPSQTQSHAPSQTTQSHTSQAQSQASQSQSQSQHSQGPSPSTQDPSPGPSAGAMPSMPATPVFSSHAPGPVFSSNPTPAAASAPPPPPPLGPEVDALSAGELWASMQAFYEPTVWWGVGDEAPGGGGGGMGGGMGGGLGGTGIGMGLGGLDLGLSGGMYGG